MTKKKQVKDVEISGEVVVPKDEVTKVTEKEVAPTVEMKSLRNNSNMKIELVINGKAIVILPKQVVEIPKEIVIPRGVGLVER